MPKSLRPQEAGYFVHVSGFPRGNDVGELGNVIFCQIQQSTTTLLWVFNHIKIACAPFWISSGIMYWNKWSISKSPTSLQM